MRWLRVLRRRTRCCGICSSLDGVHGNRASGAEYQALVAARAAAYNIFETIRRGSLIDPLSTEGKTLENVSGEIEIKDVTFAYPSRPDVQVCSNYSLTIGAGRPWRL